jgi:hypothetical protein
MLDMGFLPSLRIILHQLPAKRQTMLFSATIERSVAHLVEVTCTIRCESRWKRARNGRQIDLFCYEVPQGSKFDLLVHLLKNEKGSFLVFVATKEGADRLTKFLERGKYKVACIHGDRSQSQRNEALQGFKDGVYRILVATDVAARGIHVDDIAHVVNYDLPQEAGKLHSSHRPHGPRRRPRRLLDLRDSARTLRCAQYESLLGIQVQYRELPALPRPIGLVTDVQAFLASMAIPVRPPVSRPDCPGMAVISHRLHPSGMAFQTPTFHFRLGRRGQRPKIPATRSFSGRFMVAAESGRGAEPLSTAIHSWLSRCFRIPLRRQCRHGSPATSERGNKLWKRSTSRQLPALRQA